MPNHPSPSSDPSVIETLSDLIRINSVNPNADDGVPESQIAAYVFAFFQNRGIECDLDEVLPGRPNVVARIPGAESKRRIILSAQLDTTSVRGMTIDPFDPVVRDGQMLGRGACDAKGALAAMLHAVADVAAMSEPPPTDIVFAATIDAAFSYEGARHFCQKLIQPQSLMGKIGLSVKEGWNASRRSLFPSGPPADAAIIAAPTSLFPVIASKGLLRFLVETRGRAAHIAKPNRGNSAIEQMMVVISAIQKDNERLAQRIDPLLGPATCNISMIRGGEHAGGIPATCQIEIDRRMLPNETPDSVLADFRCLLDKTIKQTPRLDAFVHPPTLNVQSFATDRETMVVETLCEVLNDLGHHSTPIGVPFCSNASKFAAVDIPSVVFGPGRIDQSHSAAEQIDCQSVLDAVEVYRELIFRF